jgi:hypothetical protein
MAFEFKSFPPPPKPIVPPVLVRLFAANGYDVTGATKIEVHRDPATLYTEVTVHTGRNYFVIRFTDEMWAGYGLNLDEISPPLPRVQSRYPILGWRQWELRDANKTEIAGEWSAGMYGLFGKIWETPLMQAYCNGKPSAPHEMETCGIYFRKRAVGSPIALGRVYAEGLVVAESVIEHEYGYRAGLVRCIAISRVHPEAHGWDGIPIMSFTEQYDLFNTFFFDPSTIPYPNDVPAP